MIALIALATAALPSPAQAKNIQCVAMLAMVANSQKRGSAWRDVEDVRAKGSEFAAIVGVDVMNGTGATREAVRDQMVSAYAALNKAGVLSRPAVLSCIATMNAHLAAAKAEEPAKP
jgi:hypothetical protein